MSESLKKTEMAGRLSIFQRSMLLWNGLHAYNAVHVARIPGRLEADRLAGIINGRLERLGLTGLVLDPGRKRFHYCGGPARVALKLIERPDPRAAVGAEVRKEINTPFPIDTRFTPFRFFAVPGADAFDLGAAYCHFISDAHSVVSLLADIARAYAGERAEKLSAPPQLYADADRCLLPVMARHVPRWIASAPALLGRLLKCSKPRYASRTDQENGFRFFTVGRGRFRALAEAARSWSVTLNDVFLAALVKSLAPLAAERIRASRRKQLGVSSIVSARRDLPGNASGKFGLFLGNFVVSHPLPERTPLKQLAGDVRRKTATSKKHKLHLRTLAQLRAALCIMPLCSTDRQQKLYRQHYPQWGGVTNLNLNPLSRQPGRRAILDYFRAVSTGPVCPLVLAITTYNDALNIGVSYRTTVFSEEAIAGVISGFSRCLVDPANT